MKKIFTYVVAAVAAISMFGMASCTEQAPAKKQIGIQMYSVHQDYANIEPALKSQFCILFNNSTSGVLCNTVSKSPIKLFSSSIVPYASILVQCLHTRVPPTNEVVPLSPPFVYIFILLTF